MCAYQSAKKQFSREEIIEILQKNVDLYKGESNFASYITDLALYLVEYGYKREEESAPPVEKGVSFQGAKSQKVYKVFRAPSTGETAKYCPFCGAPLTSDAVKCYQCGNIL